MARCDGSTHSSRTPSRESSSYVGNRSRTVRDEDRLKDRHTPALDDGNGPMTRNDLCRVCPLNSPTVGTTSDVVKAEKRVGPTAVKELANADGRSRHWTTSDNLTLKGARVIGMRQV